MKVNDGLPWSAAGALCAPTRHRTMASPPLALQSSPVRTPFLLSPRKARPMTAPGDTLHTLETGTVHVSLRRDGIILQRMLPVQRQTLQDARDNLGASNTLAAGTPHPMLLDARHPVTIDAGVSNFYSSPRDTGSISPMAVLLGSPLGRQTLPSDKAPISQMQDSLKKSNGKFSAAVLTIINSRQFLNRRGEPAVAGNP